MILARRILPFISPLVMVFLFSGLIFRPLQWAWWITLLLVLLVVTMGFMVEWRFGSVTFWGLTYPALILFTGGTGLLFFVPSLWMQILLAVVIVLLFGMYIEDVFVYRYQAHRYSKLSLPRLGFFISIISLFSLYSTGFALRLIEVLQPWQITLAVLLVCFSFMVYVLWSYQVWSRALFGIAAVGALLIAELVWLLQYWPHAFFILGALTASGVYVIGGLIQLDQRDALTRPMLLRYLIVGFFTVVVVLATSQLS